MLTMLLFDGQIEDLIAHSHSIGIHRIRAESQIDTLARITYLVSLGHGHSDSVLMQNIEEQGHCCMK